MNSYFTSSVGRKHLMGLTGLGLVGFVFVHMVGNLLIFVGPDAYNKYSHALISNPLIYLAEGGLLAMFLVHVFLAISLSRENRLARPQPYAMPTNGDKGVCPASRTMAFHGMVLLAFTIYHLATIKFGPHYDVTLDGVKMRDMHRLVVEVFHVPGYTLWYVFALVMLASHLSHGFSSAFQSLGFNHPAWTPRLKCFGWLYAAVVSLGFMAPPLYLFFTR